MEESELLKKRKEKIDSLKAEGIDLYPNDVKVKDTTEDILSRFSEMDHDQLAQVEERFNLAGRIMAIRDFVAFTLLLILLIVRPYGILGKPQPQKV